MYIHITSRQAFLECRAGGGRQIRAAEHAEARESGAVLRDGRDRGIRQVAAFAHVKARESRAVLRAGDDAVLRVVQRDPAVVVLPRNARAVGPEALKGLAVPGRSCRAA